MKKEFKVGDKVIIDATIEKINGDIVSLRYWNQWTDNYHVDVLKPKEPEFIPREMLVWDDYESRATNHFVVEKSNSFYISKYKDGSNRFVAWKNAKELPKTLENGKVYKTINESVIIYKTNQDSGFGFWQDMFLKKENYFSFKENPENWQPYPLEDFKKLLIAEAEKRGFKSGVWVDRKELFKQDCWNRIVKFEYNQEYTFRIENDYFHMFSNGELIFKNGIWAKIID